MGHPHPFRAGVFEFRDCVRLIHGMGLGAVEKTRTSTEFPPQRPQRCASTSSATTALFRHSLALPVPFPYQIGSVLARHNSRRFGNRRHRGPTRLPGAAIHVPARILFHHAHCPRTPNPHPDHKTDQSDERRHDPWRIFLPSTISSWWSTTRCESTSPLKGIQDCHAVEIFS